MVHVCQTRDLNIKEVLSHPLGPIPRALATPEGLRRTTSKSTLANELIKLFTTPEKIPRASATAIDGMAIVQKVNGNNKTMRAISNAVLAIALSEAEGSVSTDIVFDVYKDISIKNAEQQKRSNNVKAIFTRLYSPARLFSSGIALKQVL